MGYHNLFLLVEDIPVFIINHAFIQGLSFCENVKIPSPVSNIIIKIIKFFLLHNVFKYMVHNG